MEVLHGGVGNFRIPTKLNKENYTVERATLLHLAGMGVQCLLSGLPESREKYEDVTATLARHFRPKKWDQNDIGSGREHITIDTFMEKLKVLSLFCDFGAAVEDNIVGKIIEKYYYDYLPGTRDREGKEGYLSAWREKNQRFLDNSDVNLINKYDKTSPLSNATTTSCFSCGRYDHPANYVKYRAKSAECRKCKNVWTLRVTLQIK